MQLKPALSSFNMFFPGRSVTGSNCRLEWNGDRVSSTTISRYRARKTHTQ
uniref:Uncharacterized protein n=1 Tax=Ascaris lumbricoides TaxID=6252 RepID=A0A0M3I512_ASCLU